MKNINPNIQNLNEPQAQKHDEKFSKVQLIKLLKTDKKKNF